MVTPTKWWIIEFGEFYTEYLNLSDDNLIFFYEKMNCVYFGVLYFNKKIIFMELNVKSIYFFKLSQVSDQVHYLVGIGVFSIVMF